MKKLSRYAINKALRNRPYLWAIAGVAALVAIPFVFLWQATQEYWDDIVTEYVTSLKLIIFWVEDSNGS
jgi:hypothetical protein